jgi:type IV fimbrial biogenesis protein FimT
MKTAQFGFSLVELMVTVAIATILASLAVPSFRTMLVGRTVESTADTLVSDIRFARSEAIKRTTKVTICASSNGTSCTGTGALWKSGWIVFVDDGTGGTDGAVDTGDVVLRVQDAVTGITSIAATDGSSRSFFVFQATGWSQAASQSFFVTPITGSGVTARLVCVSNKGRAAIRAKGETSCT